MYEDAKLGQGSDSQVSNAGLKPIRRKTLSALVLSAGAAIASTPALAGQIFINSPHASVSGTGTGVMNAKYRVSNNNWDQSIDYGVGTRAGTFVSNRLGNTHFLVGRTYQLELRHEVGEGFVFTMTDASTGAASVLWWGAFAQSPGGIGAATLQHVAPRSSFNTLTLKVRASLSGSSLSFGAFTFSSPSLSVADGAFVDGVVSPTSVDALGNTAGNWHQRLVSSVDLSLYDWVVRGNVSVQRRPGGGSDELLRFVVAAEQYAASTPSPGGVAIALASGVFFGFSRRNPARRRGADPH